MVHNAQLYDRMGCDLLALELVRNWEFLRPSPDRKARLDEKMAGAAVVDPRQMLRRRSSLVVADLPLSPSKVPSEMRSGGAGAGGGTAAAAAGKKPPPSVFEEPSSNSLLDSFGF